jgi:hypothetical protein
LIVLLVQSKPRSDSSLKVWEAKLTFFFGSEAGNGNISLPGYFLLYH